MIEEMEDSHRPLGIYFSNSTVAQCRLRVSSLGSVTLLKFGTCIFSEMRESCGLLVILRTFSLSVTFFFPPKILSCILVGLEFI